MSYGYFSKFVADELGCKTSTIRKYALVLEGKGYVFERNGKDQRTFYDHDIDALRELMELTKNQLNSLDHAADVVMRSKVSEGIDSPVTHSVTQATQAPVKRSSSPAVPNFTADLQQANEQIQQFSKIFGHLYQEIMQINEKMSQEKTPEPLTLSPKDAAKVLGVSYSTFNRIVKEEGIKHTKIGRKRLFRMEVLEEWLKTKEEQE